MVIQIGLAGTHATGKSTLADRIEMELRSTGISVQRTGGLAKRAATLGFPKMNRHTATSTEWIITAGAANVLEAELDADVVLIDRTAHDALAYYTAALALRGEHPEPDDLTRLQTLAALHTHRLHVLLATVLDPHAPFTTPPGKDPAYTNPTFRALVDQHLHLHLADHHIEHQAVPQSGHSEAVAATVAAVTSELSAA